MTWRLVYVAPNAEQKVVAEMVERKLTAYAPVETVWRGLSGRRHRYSRPLIRGYVFADIGDSLIPTVAHLPGVVRLIGSANGPGVMPAAFVQELQSSEAKGQFDQTQSKHKRLAVGQEVKITRGPYQGIMASIGKLTNERRIQLLLTFCGGRGSMEIDIGSVEAVASTLPLEYFEIGGTIDGKAQRLRRDDRLMKN